MSQELEEGLLIALIIVCCVLTVAFAWLMSKKMEKDILEERRIRDGMVEKYGFVAMNYHDVHPI